MIARLQRYIGLVVASVTIILLAHTAASSFTLEQVRQRNELLCGVSADQPGFSKADTEGNWHGLNVDFCRAIAAAVLGDSEKVKFLPLADRDSFTAILSGEVDLLSMNLEWNLSYDTSVGVDFCGISFFDGMGFMVEVKRGLSSALELENSVICSNPVNSDPDRLKAFFSKHNLSYSVIEFGDRTGLKQAIESGRCDAISGDVSDLAILRQQLARPENYQILPETISRKPLGPVVRQGDDGWFNIVRWVLHVLIIAEEEGLTSFNLETMKSSSSPDVQKLLGLDSISGKGLGLPDDWVVQVITQIGNYGEIFARNLGSDSSINMDRNLNELWNRGGLHYAPSID